MMLSMTTTERTYINAYRNILDAVYNVEKFVSSSLRNQVDALEATMTEARMEQLRDIARNSA